MRLIADGVLHSEFLEAVLPDGHFGLEAEGEASFDVLHSLLDGDVGCGRDEKVEVVGHEDEGMELVAAFGSVFVEGLEEEVGVRVGLEEAAAIRGDGGDEEGSDFLGGSLHRSKLERGAAGERLRRCGWGHGENVGEFDWHLTEGERPAARAACFSGPLFHGLKAMASTVASLCEALCASCYFLFFAMISVALTKALVPLARSINFSASKTSNAISPPSKVMISAPSMRITRSPALPASCS